MSDHNASPEAGLNVPVSPPRENLYRAIRGIEVRDDAAGMPTLTGHFAVWDQWTEIRSVYEGNFMERFSGNSMNKTLSENVPKVLFQHGKDPQIGDKVLGIPASVEADDYGARYEVPLFDTSYNRDLIPGLKANAYGASFRFSVLKDDFNQKPARSETNPRGIPERTVTEARVVEFGPVTFPAYIGATAGVRSLTDEFLFAQFVDDPDRLRELIQAITVAEPRNFAQHYVANNADARTSDEPESSEATTPEHSPGTDEPEPSEATTHSNRGRFWFADTPDHLKRS